MGVVAIYNVWADWEYLQHSIKNLKPLVDGIIIIGSNRSNYGEVYPVPEWVLDSPNFYLREPQYGNAREAETDKRNYGLLKAKQLGYTHFLSLDADEMYNPEQFLKAKAQILNEDLAGLVCPTRVYFASPTLTIGFDGTYVPFIHKLTIGIRHEFNIRYPFAYDTRLRIDPTRSMNITSGVKYSDELICEHFSWCRGDYDRKIRNSTAKANLERSTIRQDLMIANEGVFCNYYQKTLVRVPNVFNLPLNGELLRKDIRSVPATGPADESKLQ